MWAAMYGDTDIAVALLKAKASINHKDDVRVGLAGWMVACVCRLSTLWGWVKVEMSRACCCSVSHTDVISPITTIQYGNDAIGIAKNNTHPDTASVIKKVVGERV